MKNPRAVFLPVILIALLWGCASTQLPEDASELPAPKLIQRAQEAADKGNFHLAMSYYEAVRKRFADDTERVLWASYEIAFLYHKMGDDEEAVRLFDELLAEYDRNQEANLPPGPRILAQKVKANILSNQALRR